MVHGSFTGIRIGVAACKAMAFVNNISLVSVSSLETLAFNEEFTGTICSLIDCKNNNVYCGIFDCSKNLLEPYMACSIDEAIESICKYEKVMFVGSGIDIHKNKLTDKLPNIKVHFSINNKQSAFCLGKCGYIKYLNNNVESPDSIVPLYLRKSRSRKNEKFMNNLKICKMEFSDLEKIAPTLSSSFDDFWNYTTLKSELLNTNSDCIVCKNENDEIIGFASIWKAVDDVHITDIVVRYDLRQNGIGSLLLEKLIEMANAFNVASITLEVNEKNLPAQKLYLKYNFDVAGKRKNYYGTNDALIMTLNLRRN